MYNKKILLTTSFLLTAAVLLVPQASAQKAALNIGIAPPLTHIVIKPGKTALTTVTLENQGLFDVNLTPNFVDFSSDNKTGTPVLGESMSFPYISLQDESYHLNSPTLLKTGESRQLVFEVALPENSLEKEYHFSLVFAVDPKQNILSDGATSAVTGQIATNFIVTVANSAADQGNVRLQSFAAPIIVDSLGAINAQVTMQNVGKNTTVALGDFTITNALGNVVYQTQLLPENILPGSSREVFAAKTVTKGAETAETSEPLHYKGLFLLGPYTMKLSYKAPGQSAEVFTHRVFALPISILIGIVIGAIVYLTYSKTKLFQTKRKVSKTHESNTQ